MVRRIELWQRFCQAHRIAETAVPLFACEGDRVLAQTVGRDGRLILQRSLDMEARVIEAVETLESLHGDGILYMMLWKEGDRITPLYIGKAGRIGRNGADSANLRNLRRDKSKFGRWGSNYAYHIGDLSAVVCAHDSRRQSRKYALWADALFADLATRTLRRPVWFWVTTWTRQSPSIWEEVHPCSLSFQEYLLIGIASDLFPDILLNQEGVNRSELVAGSERREAERPWIHRDDGFSLR